MKYLSVCSGIEAASVAWHDIPGWEPVAFSEIEKFPSRVLAHHFPNVPNLGDMTKFKEWKLNEPIDLLVGGTPCQAFSVAGLRKGLADPRGNLTLTFLAMVDHFRPKWVVWENVPGVMSDKTGAFGAFLGGLGELGYGWAYRVLDAQYFGVAQRRRRVFVVGHSGGQWQRAASVLFEPESLRRDSPPSREAGKGVAGTIGARTSRSIGAQDAMNGHMIPEVCGTLSDGAHNGGGSTDRTHTQDELSRCLNAGGMGRIDWETETFVTVKQEPIAFSSKDHGADAGELAPTLRSMGHSGSHANGVGQVAVAFTQNQSGDVLTGAVFPSMGTNSNATGRKTPKIQSGMAVRRLTPRECERLQGFPDDYTLIPVGKKMAADGPRYKALGNSMAVPCMKWIGQRIALVDAIP